MILRVHSFDILLSINGKYLSQVGVVAGCTGVLVPLQISSGICSSTRLPLLSTVRSLQSTSARVLRLPVSLLVISPRVILVIPLVILAICSGVHWIESDPLNLLEPLTSNVALEGVVLIPTFLVLVLAKRVGLEPDHTIRSHLESVCPLISSSLLG